MKPRKSKPGRTHPAAPDAHEAILDALGDERIGEARRLAARYRELPEGYVRWAEDTAYVLDKHSNTYVPFRFTEWQKAELRRILTPDDAGNLQYLTLVLSWPRRHGKSLVAALYDIWRALNFDHQNVVIGSNSKEQTLSTAYQAAEETIRNSPKLKRMLDAGEIVITTNVIAFARTGSEIKGIPTSEASAYGQKINVGHVTELCKALTDALYQVIASSTGDAHLGVAICDSNVGAVDNIVWQLIQLAESGEDPTIGVSYIHYTDVDDAIAQAPPWIDAAWLRSRLRQMTRGEFRRNHLNIPAAAGEKLFTRAQVDRCFTSALPGWGTDGEAMPAPLPRVFSAEEFRRLRRDCALMGVLSVGGGLDRAMPFAHRDRTFWASGAKLLVETTEGEIPVYDEDGELVGLEAPDPWVYVLLNLVAFPYSNAEAIKRVIAADRERYERFDNVSFEQYQAGDLWTWGQTQGIPCVLTHFTAPVQMEAYSDFYRVVASGRFYASAAHWILREEMMNAEEDASGRTPSFGGPRVTVRDPEGKAVRIKDDAVEAVVNLFIALRGEMRAPASAPLVIPGHSRFAPLEVP